MQKITDTLYIQQDALVRYVMIQLDLSGSPLPGNQYRIILKLAGSKDHVQVCRSAAIEVLLPKLRLIANRLSLRRLTDTLYVHTNVLAFAYIFFSCSFCLPSNYNELRLHCLEVWLVYCLAILGRIHSKGRLFRLWQF